MRIILRGGGLINNPVRPSIMGPMIQPFNFIISFLRRRCCLPTPLRRPPAPTASTLSPPPSPVINRLGVRFWEAEQEEVRDDLLEHWMGEADSMVGEEGQRKTDY